MEAAQKIDELYRRVAIHCLWSTAEIAAFMGFTPQYVRERVVCQPEFPSPIVPRRWDGEQVKEFIRMYGGRL
jgi:hypothetical protein